MRHLAAFAQFHGFDTDDRALARFRQSYPDADVHLYPRVVTAADIEHLRPTKVLLMGLLHHLTDAEATELLLSLRAAGTVARIVTWDTIYLPGKPLSNLLAWLDRGRHTRDEAHYVKLLESAAWHRPPRVFLLGQRTGHVCRRLPDAGALLGGPDG